MGGQGSKSSFSSNNPNSNTVNFINNSSEQSVGKCQIIEKNDMKEDDVWQTFTWNYGGNTVLLTGSFFKWKQTMALQKQAQQFSITIPLPRGIHQYKFIVDGQWRFSPEDPIIPDPNGNINNVVDTTNTQKFFDNKKQKSAVKDQGTDKQPPMQGGVQQFAKIAPKLPPHYQSCSFLKGIAPYQQKPQLNNPNMNNQSKKFEQSLTQEQILDLFNSPHCLAPPYHVEVDHLIRQVSSKCYSSYCINQRFKNKYTTYKYFMTGKETNI